MTIYNFQEAVVADHGFLRKLLAVPQETRNYAWNHDLYQILPRCFFEVGEIIQAQNGRYAAHVKLANDSMIASFEEAMTETQWKKVEPTNNADNVQIKNLKSLSRYCLENICGIAIFLEDDVDPNTILRFGSVWSFCEYGELAGCHNVISAYEDAYKLNPEDPFNVMVREPNQYLLGTPSEEFFPMYVRDFIIQELKHSIPDSRPTFHLKSEPHYAMPDSIQVALGVPCNDETRVKIQNNLLWYMPPYLPISVC